MLDNYEPMYARTYIRLPDNFVDKNCPKMELPKLDKNLSLVALKVIPATMHQVLGGYTLVGIPW